jgi:hypothetical protein
VSGISEANKPGKHGAGFRRLSDFCSKTGTKKAVIRKAVPMDFKFAKALEGRLQKGCQTMIKGHIETYKGTFR